MDPNPTFEKQRMEHVRFHDCAMPDAIFNDINMARTRFENVNLSGASFDDVNLSHVSITNACIEGLVIWGIDVHQLVQAELDKRRGA